MRSAPDTTASSARPATDQTGRRKNEIRIDCSRGPGGPDARRGPHLRGVCRENPAGPSAHVPDARDAPGLPGTGEYALQAAARRHEEADRRAPGGARAGIQGRCRRDEGRKACFQKAPERPERRDLRGENLRRHRSARMRDSLSCDRRPGVFREIEAVSEAAGRIRRMERPLPDSAGVVQQHAPFGACRIRLALQRTDAGGTARLPRADAEARRTYAESGLYAQRRRPRDRQLRRTGAAALCRARRLRRRHR